VSTFSGKSIFGQDGPKYQYDILKQTIFGEIYREIYFVCLYLLLNNPQITKALSVSSNFTLDLEIIQYLIISKTYNILGLVFKHFTLNNNNNFFNSLKYKLINSHLIYTIINKQMVTYNSSFLSLTNLFYSVLIYTSLTPEIFFEIVQIKQGMNKNRLPQNYTAKTSLYSNFSSITKPNLTKKSVESVLTKRHYSSAIIREKQYKLDQIQYLE
jgi:hypothetical protein